MLLAEPRDNHCNPLFSAAVSSPGVPLGFPYLTSDKLIYQCLLWGMGEVHIKKKLGTSRVRLC